MVDHWIVWILLPVRHPLEPPGLVDDPFEQPSDRPIVQRSPVHLRDVRENLGLACRLVDVDASRLLHTTDFQRAGGARGEEAHQLLIELVDAFPQRLDEAYRLLFSHFTYSLACAHTSLDPLRAIVSTSALPTTAASAARQASATC